MNDNHKLPFLNASEAAKIANVTPRTIRRWVIAGHFPNARKINPDLKRSSYVIPRNELEAFLEKRQQ